MMNSKWVCKLVRAFAALSLGIACGLSYGQALFPSNTTQVIAGQNFDIGRVTCGYLEGSRNEGRCDIQLNSEWCTNLIHVYVGEQKPLSMAPGQFPFQSRPPSCVSNWSIPIKWAPANTCAISEQFIAFHAEVNRSGTAQQETAWGKGVATGQNWSMLFKLICAQLPT